MIINEKIKLMVLIKKKKTYKYLSPNTIERVDNQKH